MPRAVSLCAALSACLVLSAASACSEDEASAGSEPGSALAGRASDGSSAGPRGQGAGTDGGSSGGAADSLAGGDGGSAGGAGTDSGGSGGASAGGAGGGGAGASGDGGAAGGAGMPPASTLGSCPDTLPTDGASCSAAVTCSYGDHPRIACRQFATCSEVNGVLVWSVRDTSCTLDAACPATLPPAGTVCDEADYFTVCYYPDGSVCTGCQSCGDGPPPGPWFPCEGHPEGTVLWSCAPPPTTPPGCPDLIPNDGAPCDLDEGLVCAQDACPWNGGRALEVVCTDGTWRWLYTDCPDRGPQPVCASPDTPIATPEGERPIASLSVGDLVYSADVDGIVAVPIARVNRTPVHDHRVVRVTLENGRTLHVSGGHPTADGRTFADLRAGGLLDGIRILEASVVPYQASATYDILPATQSGTYYAAGVLVGSTLR